MRQIQEATLEGLRREVASTPELAAVLSLIRDDLGLVFTARNLADTMGVDPDTATQLIEARLLLFLAGPYRVGAKLIVSSTLDWYWLRCSVR